MFILVDIKNKKATAPTPQNTPINTAPINSHFNPSIPAITEEMETITTSGKLHKIIYLLNIMTKYILFIRRCFKQPCSYEHAPRQVG